MTLPTPESIADGAGCPSCGRACECPCESCAKRKPTDWKLDPKRDEFVQCPCGVSLHTVAWMDLEWGSQKALEN